ncbi:hypothetical protein [Thalassotalea profundi]|uniref:Uncharacterized protein n=1 Tax=Thalassotalea profundi TaxID=2036687 RepID=A0ABQ3IJJ4_9GAMM|nr:hypothetical protein [Thalassotalea profundi]GHE85589.1 hypothetical protein GCM10011501_13320 [Thalassotalea profundi]
MKKTLIACILLTLVSSSSFAQEDEVELKQASKEYVLSLLKMCQGYAVEDETPKDELDAYLLTCINDELESEDYYPIKALPKA